MLQNGRARGLLQYIVNSEMKVPEETWKRERRKWMDEQIDREIEGR